MKFSLHDALFLAVYAVLLLPSHAVDRDLTVACLLDLTDCRIALKEAKSRCAGPAPTPKTPVAPLAPPIAPVPVARPPVPVVTPPVPVVTPPVPVPVVTPPVPVVTPPVPVATPPVPVVTPPVPVPVVTPPVPVVTPPVPVVTPPVPVPVVTPPVPAVTPPVPVPVVTPPVPIVTPPVPVPVPMTPVAPVAPVALGTLLVTGDENAPLNAFPLKMCEGDCDVDGDCAGDLVCFQRDDDPAPIPGCIGTPDYYGTDYCYDKTFNGPPAPVTPGSLVVTGDENIPAFAFPLNKCEGDCDADADCAGNLVCYQRGSAAVPVPGCIGTPDYYGTDYCCDTSVAGCRSSEALSVKACGFTCRLSEMVTSLFGSRKRRRNLSEESSNAVEESSSTVEGEDRKLLFGIARRQCEALVERCERQLEAFSCQPSSSPSIPPSLSPTKSSMPSPEPSIAPSQEPTITPRPTKAPTRRPTKRPTAAPIAQMGMGKRRDYLN